MTKIPRWKKILDWILSWFEASDIEEEPTLHPKGRYRLSLTNLNSLSDVFSFSAGKKTIIVSLAIILLLTGIFWILMLGFTPVGNLLPGRMPNELRERYIQMAIKVDSLTTIAQSNERYAANIRAIFADSLPAADTARVIPALQDIPLDSLVGASDAERRFVASYDDQERFNLSVLTPIAVEAMAFYPPVAASPRVQVTMSQGDIPAASIAVGHVTPVSAIYRGTVINAYFTTGRGVTVMIQHPNDFISVYNGLSEVFVRRGDKVDTGERVGLASTDRYSFSFELWHKGTPLDPTEHIRF